MLICITLKAKRQGEQEEEGPRNGEGEVEKESEREREKSWSFISTFIILFKPFFLKKKVNEDRYFSSSSLNVLFSLILPL